MKSDEENAIKEPIESLWENASMFFDKVALKYGKEMSCKSGCSKCCHTDISVFDVESNILEKWFLHLSDEAKLDLKNKWKEPRLNSACVFLHQDKCTVYPARPIICRTQGLPLHLSTENILDYCDLNFLNTTPEKEDWLNLDRLNTLLTLAAKTSKKDQRQSLKKIQKKLLNL